MLYIHQILNGIWQIDNQFALNYLPYIINSFKGETPGTQSMSKEEREVSLDHEAVLFASIKNGSYVISEYGDAAPPERAPENSIAIINVVGAITKYDQSCGPAGLVTKASILTRCYTNDNIKAVILVSDSGGGSAYAWPIMDEAIGNRNKPVLGFVSDFCASAAYGMLSGCDVIIANNNNAVIGSIGTYNTILDIREQLKMEGINLIETYATLSKDKNAEYKAALDGDEGPLRKKIDVLNQSFVNTIAKNRKDKLTSEESEWNTGKTFFAPEALKMGLIDGIDKIENVVNYFNT